MRKWGLVRVCLVIIFVDLIVDCRCLVGVALVALVHTCVKVVWGRFAHLGSFCSLFIFAVNIVGLVRSMIFFSEGKDVVLVGWRISGSM